MTINPSRERLEAASNELNGQILLGRPIDMTFKRVPKKVVTGATKVKARVVSEEAEEEDSQEPRIRRGSQKPPGTYSQESFSSGLQGKPVPRFLTERRKPYSIIGYLR